MRKTMTAIIVALAIVVPGVAIAHSWYDPWCCTVEDCKPYREEVKETPKGYLLHDGTLVPYAEAKVSQDGEYHRCIWNGQHRCFYAPPPSF